MIAKKDLENIASIIGHYNLNEDFVAELIRYFKQNNTRFNEDLFKKRIAKTRNDILQELDNRGDKHKIREYLTKLRQCPLCGKQFRGIPALSRSDDKTDICPDCGTLEAFEDFLGYVGEL